MAIERRKRGMGAIATRGVIAGLIGAVAMAALMMLVSANRGTGLFTPLQLIGATIVGDEWRTAGAALIGLVLHLVVAVVVGVVYTALIGHRVASRSMNAILGIVFAAAVFAPMTYLVLPAIDPIMGQAINTGVLFFAHVVYGLAMGLAVGPMGRLAELPRQRVEERYGRTTV